MKAGNRMRAKVAALMGMIAEGNDKFRAAMKRINPDEYVAKPKSGSHRKYWPNTPNPKRRATKTLNGEIKHMLHPRGNNMPAPTLDQTRALEQRIGRRVRVKSGKCYLRSDGPEGNIPIPLDTTSDGMISLTGMFPFMAEDCHTSTT